MENQELDKQNKYIFILGRNPQLSLEEVLSYFRRSGRNLLEYKVIENALYVSLGGKKIKENEIENLGGVIEIAEVLSDSKNVGEIKKELEEKEIFSMGDKPGKLNYLIWDFSFNEENEDDNLEDSDIYEEISDYLSKRAKQEKLKASKKKLNEMSLQSEKGKEGKKEKGGEKVQAPYTGKIDDEFVIFSNPSEFSGRILFGKTIQKCNYEKLEKRDMEKPVRRSGLSISPRLAKILINLTEIPLKNISERNSENSEKVLLDPFSGIGCIVQEALLQNIKVIGIDKDSEAIKNAGKNLDNFIKSYNKEKLKADYLLINDDSSKIQLSNSLDIGGIATEPYLGETLRKIPSEEDAKKIISEFEEVIISVLKNLENYLQKGKRIVFTAPLIKTTRKDRISCDLDKILEKTGLKKPNNTKNRIPEFREGQITGREIIILEK